MGNTKICGSAVIRIVSKKRFNSPQLPGNMKIFVKDVCKYSGYPIKIPLKKKHVHVLIYATFGVNIHADVFGGVHSFTSFKPWISGKP